MKTRSPLILASILIATSAAVLSASVRSPAGPGAAESNRHEERHGMTATLRIAGRGTSAADDAVSRNGGVRLLEYAGNSAVFREGETLRRVRIGERVPGSDAVLRHVNVHGVLVEFAAHAGSPARMQSVMRGRLVERPAVDTSLPAASQHLLTSSVHTTRAPEAKQANTPDAQGTGLRR